MTFEKLFFVYLTNTLNINTSVYNS